jgi:hypothetical protein
MSPQDTLTFIAAGRAVFTITSTATGQSYTFRFGRPQDQLEGGPIFAAVLTGPDNSTDYTYMGIYYPARRQVVQTRGSRVSADAPSLRALNWFLAHLGDPRVQFRHEGRCGRCARPLTVPSSIDTGLGPECAGRVLLEGLTRGDQQRAVGA